MGHDVLDGPSTTPALVGRAHELAVLREVVGRPPRLAIVEGEAGVGKTKLVRELFRMPEADGRPKLVGHCHALREPFPLGPLVEPLRQAAPLLQRPERLDPVAGALRPLLPEMADRLPPSPEPVGEPAAERHRVFRAVVEILRSVGPAVLVLEDLHWADPWTIEFLTFLTPNFPEGLSVILTYRPEDASASLSALSSAARRHLGSDATVVLEPLDAAGVRALVSAILETDDVSAEFAEYLHERTSGLPFAVEEVLRLLGERSDIVKRNGRWARRALDELRVPDALRDSIGERASRLPENARRVLRAAAVIGEAADDALLARVAELSPRDMPSALAAVLRSALLVELPDGRVDFRHALARQSVSEDIPGPERRWMHLLVARALEEAGEQEALGRLAVHFREARRPAEWARCAEAAADLAASLHDDDTACRYLIDALAAPGLSSSARARMAVKLGRASLHGVVQHEVVHVLRETLARGDLQAGARGEVRVCLARVLRRMGDASGTYVEFERAVPDLKRRPALAVRAMNNLAAPFVLERDVTEHRSWLERAERTILKVTDPLARTVFLVDRAAVLVALGDPRGWAATLDVPPPSSVMERRELARGMANLAEAAFHLGHVSRAESFRSQGIGLAEELGYDRIVPNLLEVGLLVDWAAGRWDALEERARALALDAEEVPQVRVGADVVLGAVLLARGEITEATAVLEGAVELGERAGAVPARAAAGALLAHLFLLRGEERLAVERASEAWEVVRRKRTWAWGGAPAEIAVRALLARGDVAGASGIVSELSRGIRGLDAPFAATSLVLARGHMRRAVGEAKAAARAYRRVRRELARVPRSHDSARAAELLGQTLLETGDAAGERALREALEGFDRLGATWDADRVRAILRHFGVALPHHGGRRGYGDELSPREAEVAALAARGHTNREIAELLFLSTRTVEHHVARAMRKRRVSTRLALRSAHPTDKDRYPPPIATAEDRSILPTHAYRETTGAGPRTRRDDLRPRHRPGQG